MAKSVDEKYGISQKSQAALGNTTQMLQEKAATAKSTISRLVTGIVSKPQCSSEDQTDGTANPA